VWVNSTREAQTSVFNKNLEEYFMYKSKYTLTAAIAGILALSLAGISGQAFAGKPGMEKCQGIAKTGQNDCGTSKHACAGQAAADGDAEEWVYVPEGTCAKIAGGSVKAAKK
jgi:uncharacterized membrane protein